eukprot:TRINITY_DN1672_c1_g2_i1.p1 TRINITY_DN1672_c1_g2~~TRINITY_DN1672_c1_g2_i1.p1  ORF type:complete len:345 (-),score=61.57 TRINITY_DN1672_c1_g2_i1:202-1236(-)
MIPLKKAKSMVHANNTGFHYTTSTSTEPNQLDHNEPTSSFQCDDFGDEDLKRKSRSIKGKEKVVTEPREVIVTQPNYKLERETEQQQKGRHLFPGDPVICQLIQAADLFERLDLQSVLTVSQTSKQILQQLSPFISSTFMLKYHDYTNIQHYHPKKLLVSTNNLGTLFINPFLTKVYKIKFDDDCKFELTQLPDSVTHLALPKRFNSKISKHLSNITNLKFGWFFNYPISSETLPRNLTYIKFGVYFNQIIDYLLPEKLTHLKFHKHSHFTKTVNGLPPNLTFIQFGQHFRQFISQLPSSMKQVIFFYGYNLPVDHLLEVSKNIQFKIRTWENKKLVCKTYPPS